jgi:nitroreductase
MDLDKAIQTRKSVKKFKKKKPDWRDILECIDAARYAPMAGNNFTLKFIVVSDEEKIKQISESAQQPFIAEAKYIVVICSNPSRPVNAYEDKGEIFVRQQAGAGIQNFLLKIQEAGLSTCWVGYFVEDQIKKTLGIPEDIQIEGIFPIGYEDKKGKTRKTRIDLNHILYFDKYGNKRMKKAKSLDV